MVTTLGSLGLYRLQQTLMLYVILLSYLDNINNTVCLFTQHMQITVEQTRSSNIIHLTSISEVSKPRDKRFLMTCIFGRERGQA